MGERICKEWIAAWNSHNRDRILSHVGEFEMSPLIHHAKHTSVPHTAFSAP